VTALSDAINHAEKAKTRKECHKSSRGTKLLLMPLKAKFLKSRVRTSEGQGSHLETERKNQFLEASPSPDYFCT